MEEKSLVYYAIPLVNQATVDKELWIANKNARVGGGTMAFFVASQSTVEALDMDIIPLSLIQKTVAKMTMVPIIAKSMVWFGIPSVSPDTKISGVVFVVLRLTAVKMKAIRV
jgi:hypothetical protein